MEKDQDTIVVTDSDDDRDKSRNETNGSKVADFVIASLRNQQIGVPNENDFLVENNNGGLIETDFLAAPQLEMIGKSLIRKYRDKDFAHLGDANIVYLWKQKGGGKGGKRTLGKCVKPSGLAKYFMTAKEREEFESVHYVIWAAADHARISQMKIRQFQALIFHKLMHTEKVDGRFQIRSHEFEGFAREIEEFGMWKNDIEGIAKACETVKSVQQGLFV